MINKENILQTAQALVQQYGLPLKIRGVEELPEAVAIYFTSDKRVRLRELEQELELQLNLPIKLERIKKTETGKIGGVDILGKHPCCAPFLRKCPFGGKYGCGYGFASSQFTVHSSQQKDERAADAKTCLPAGRPPKPSKPSKKAKTKRKKMVRRLVIKR